MRRLATLLLLVSSWGISSPSKAQSCPNRTTIEDLQQSMSATEAAFADLDVELFSRSTEDLAIKLPCVRDTIASDVAARYHRLVGIRLFTNGNELEAFQALRAARILDNAYRFPEGMFPSGHELVVQYDALDTKERVKGRVLAPRTLNVLFDGIQTRKRPVGRATLLQFVTKEGTVRTTRLLQANEPMPTYESKPRLRKPILIGTTIASVLAASLYGGALASKAEFENQSARTTLDDLQRWQRRTNRLAGFSATFAGLALGGGISIIIVGDR